MVSGISSDILSSDILSDLFSGTSSDILSGISSDILSGISCDILSGKSSDILAYLSDTLPYTIFKVSGTTRKEWEGG